MDRDEALKLLDGGLDGVAEWNKRRGSGEKIPDLRGANLMMAKLGGANLRGANLRGADLGGADLSGADLREADLRDADFGGAYLGGANLRGADLGRADLSAADLSGANLVKANLYRANLLGADLIGAKLSGAHCSSTLFAAVDLTLAKGLDSVDHFGPSTIGVDTLWRSRGKIPEVFLRECGVPQPWIDHLPSLIGSMKPIQFYSCFISHSTKDKTFVDRLHGRMAQEKLRSWYAPHDMRGARTHEEQIDRAISVYDKLLLVISKSSLASNWVQWEIDKALDYEKREKKARLFPIRLVSLKAIQEWDCRDPRTGRDYAKEILKYHVLDFTKWKSHDAFEAAFTRLIDAVKPGD
jgi:hypothetical protein